MPPTLKLDSQRINHNSNPVGIQVQEDGNGQCNVSWTAVQVSDPTKTKHVDNQQRSANQSVDVDVFGA